MISLLGIPPHKREITKKSIANTSQQTQTLQLTRILPLFTCPPLRKLTPSVVGHYKSCHTASARLIPSKVSSPRRNQPSFGPLLALVFLSGFAALVYEVLWFRQLGLISETPFTPLPRSWRRSWWVWRWVQILPHRPEY